MKTKTLIIQLLVLLLFCFNITGYTKSDTSLIFEDVDYIEYKVTTENGIVEANMSSSDVTDFKEFVNDLQLEELEENPSLKGWLISLDCYDSNKEYMYNAYLIGNLFYVDQTVYNVDEENLNKFHQFIDSKLLK